MRRSPSARYSSGTVRVRPVRAPVVVNNSEGQVSVQPRRPRLMRSSPCSSRVAVET